MRGREPFRAPTMTPKIRSNSTRCRNFRSRSKPRKMYPMTRPNIFVPGFLVPLRSDLLFDARGLAGQIAEVIQLGASHAAAALHFDFADGRAVGLEHALDAFAVRNLAYGERGVEAAVALRDHHAFVGLGAFAVAFLHLHLHDDSVARVEVWDLARRTRLFDFLNDAVSHVRHLRVQREIHRGVSPHRPAIRLSQSDPAAATRCAPPPASTASAGCQRGARPAGRRAPSGLRTPPAACSAASRANLNQKTLRPPNDHRPALPAATAPPRRSRTARGTPRPTARSRRSKLLYLSAIR